MKQLFQDAKAGTIQVVDLPEPALRQGTLLVRNVCSVISPGTERLSVATARSSYLRTARARPDLVRRVLDTVRREGVLEAYRRVQAKLGEPQALGYSSAGVVLAIGEGAGDHFRVGDRVACAGAGVASHAEVISVPVHLAARVPEGVSFESAAFATLGAIALHGIRQAEPALGERVAVIGLGILGLLAVQMLRAAGVRVAAYDLAPEMVERATAFGAEVGLAGGTDDQVASALAWSDGMGVDAAIVTAASTSEAPMVAAAGMCRDRGRVVAVGFVPFGLPREVAYAKELELRISRSYGPGRYDASFEEKGVDYPYGYVRWTETRNLEAFLHLLAEQRVELASLVTHRTDLASAPAAYDALVASQGPRPLGMIIEYPEPAATPAPQRPRIEPRSGEPAVAPAAGEIGVAFLGAGSFARAVLLPQFSSADGVRLRHVVTAHGLSAHDAQRKFGFDHAGTDPEAAFADPDVSLVCIATRHDMHARLVARALSAGKHVFVEKPLAIDEEGLREVEAAAGRARGRLLLVGFNRRFSPMARAVRGALVGRGPILMSCRVNAGPLPSGHWLNDPDLGGGRIIGEGCHFVDLLTALTGDARVETVEAASAGRARARTEDVVIQLTWSDGSVGQILYTAKGDPSLGKERIEAHAGGLSAVIDDFRSCILRSGGKSTTVRSGGKGHGDEVRVLLEALRRGGAQPIPLASLVDVTRATFRVHAALAGQSALPVPS